MPSQKPPPRTVTDRDQRWLLRDKYHGRGVSPTDRMIDRARLEDGEPLAYVIGWVPFLGQHIDLSARPLIPRLETEWWVAHVLAQFIAREKPLKILDLFAGSGCIGLGAASRLPTAQIHFGEIDRQLLAQIQQNWELNSLTNRHHIIETDVFSAITEQYDGIFANPPYCPPERWETLDQSVTSWEPKESIVSPAGSN
ncbi:class I SAM-dependent methyltransferase, partial [Candidatus Berkelbacteria bacterium]|nr:class I SAM-dependent methyltransferase [Candidatus Berkelbacteria bacterium]